MGFPNYAGRADVDDKVEAELKASGITVIRFPELLRDSHPEMRTVIHGELHCWVFKRAWRYWIAEGPGIPIGHAMKLQESHGGQARANGDCGCQGPLHWNKGFGTGSYHVDSQEGLDALVKTLNTVVEEAKALSSEKVS